MKNMLKKMILALAVMLLLLSVGNYLLIREGDRLIQERAAMRSIRKLEAADHLNGLTLEEMDEAYDSLLINACNKVELMTAALRNYLEDGEYTGPVCFEDGFVFTVENGEAVFPDTVPEGFAGFSEDTMERAFSDEHHNGGRIRKTVDLSEEELADLEYTDPSGFLSHFFMVFIDEIGEGVYYAGLNEAAEFYEVLEIYSYDAELIAAAEEAFGGAILVLDTSDSRLPFNIRSAYFGEIDYAGDLGLTLQDVTDRREVLTIDGQQWKCAYATSTSYEDEVLIFARHDESNRLETALQFAPMTLLMILFFVTLSVYVISAQVFVRDKILSEHQASRYLPKSLRLRCMVLGAAGALLVFCAAGIMQAVSVLQSETLAGGETIQVLFENLQKLEAAKAKAARKKDEDWYLSYADRVAGLIKEDPAFMEEEKLQEFCDVLQIDYIMVFDQNGREISCNRGYTDFTLKTGENDCWNEFSKLLMGIPGLVRETETDARTGLERQLIGVSIPESGTKRNGALVMALYPDTIVPRDNSYGAFTQLKSLTVEGTTILFADADTGTILYASDPSFIGNEIGEYGLSSDTLRNGYMDFALINGIRSYIITSKANDIVIFSITDTSILFRHSLRYGTTAAAVFLVFFIALYGILMLGYTEREVDVYRRIGTPLEDFVEDADRTSHQRFHSHAWSQWRQMSPEGKAGAVFRCLSCVIVLLYLNLSQLAARMSGVRLSLYRYIMQGNWMHGINLFAFCAVAILIISGFVFLSLCKAAMRVLCKVLDSKGVTICRLTYNLIQYLTIFCLLYQAFSYLGFPTSTVLASVGLASLAITFGAQGLVADVLAGIFNVFEGGYRVGDYIVVDEFEGTVREIGVRTTKVENISQDIKIIENSQISNVINKTSLNSFVCLELVVPCSESLERIEAILKSELPRIGSGMAEIISGPDYLGVDEVSRSKVVPNEPSMTLLICTECEQNDFPSVKRYVNREILLLFEREHIRLL